MGEGMTKQKELKQVKVKRSTDWIHCEVCTPTYVNPFRIKGEPLNFCPDHINMLKKAIELVWLP